MLNVRHAPSVHRRADLKRRETSSLLPPLLSLHKHPQERLVIERSFPLLLRNITVLSRLVAFNPFEQKLDRRGG